MKTEKKTVYVCEFCGKTGAASTIRKCERKCKERRKMYDQQRERHAAFMQFRHKAASVQHFADMISEYLTKESGIDCRCSFDNPRISESASNTHSCPVDGVTNWRKDGNKPRGYPAVCCSVNVYIDGGYNPKVSGILDEIKRNKSGLNSLGGGSQDFGIGYGCSLFASDFPVFGPKILEWIEKDKARRAYMREKDALRDVWVRESNAFVRDDPAVIAAERMLRDATAAAIKAFEKTNPLPKPTLPEVTADAVNKLHEEIVG